MSEVAEKQKNNTKSPANKTVVKKQTGEKNVNNSKEIKPKIQNENVKEENNKIKANNLKNNEKEKSNIGTKKVENKTTSKTTNKNVGKTTSKTASTVKKDVIQYTPKKSNTTNNENKKTSTDEKVNEVINKKNEKKFEYPELSIKKKKKGKSKIPYNKRSASDKFDDETKYDTVSLVEIRKALENKVNPDQKKNLLKQILINLGMAVGMCLFFTIILFTHNKIEINILENSLKIITICLMIIGVFILEKSYKKDNVGMALKSIEIAFFAGLCLFLMYSTKINYGSINNIIIKIISGIGIYYLIKLIILSVKSVKKFKKENSDIKDIIKK